MQKFGLPFPFAACLLAVAVRSLQLIASLCFEAPHSLQVCGLRGAGTEGSSVSPARFMQCVRCTMILCVCVCVHDCMHELYFINKSCSEPVLVLGCRALALACCFLKQRLIVWCKTLRPRSVRRQFSPYMLWCI